MGFAQTFNQHRISDAQASAGKGAGIHRFHGKEFPATGLSEEVDEPTGGSARSEQPRFSLIFPQ
jgi:hypothetical protein